MDLIEAEEEKDLFGNTIASGPKINREELCAFLAARLSKLSLKEFVGLFVTEFSEIVEYVDLCSGEKQCGQRISMLFNPHRFQTKSITSKLSVFDALKTDSYASGLARVVIYKKNSTTPEQLLYASIGMNVNGIQYINEFPPAIARDIYAQHDTVPESKVLDPCGGWGGRMLGASVHSNYYECFEPSTKTADGLKRLRDWIQGFRPDFNAKINCIPFEESRLDQEAFDISLTSPPYYDTEEYGFDEATNSRNRYKSFNDWRDGFYIPFLDLAMRALKKEAPFIVNIGSRKYPLNEVLMEHCALRGWKFERMKNFLSVTTGLGKGKSGEGETFYKVTDNQ